MMNPSGMIDMSHLQEWWHFVKNQYEIFCILIDTLLELHYHDYNFT